MNRNEILYEGGDWMYWLRIGSCEDSREPN
jgi:hypothetical protein